MPLEDIWGLLRAETAADLRRELRETWRMFDAAARSSALDYAGFNIALRYHDVYSKAFPLAMRATTHPKASQVSVPQLGPVSPWNGVGVVTRLPRGTLSIQCMELYRLQGEQEEVVRCFLAGTEDPFYYEIIHKKGGS